MNKKPLLLIGFTRYTDKGLPVKVSLIVDSFKDNVLYADAGTKLTDVTDAVEKFLAVLGRRGKELNYKTDKAEKKTTLTDALRVLGIYVRDKYPGNVNNWLTSGFDVQTFDGNTVKPLTPTDLKAKDATNTGEALISFKAQKYANYYEGRHHLAGDPAPVDMTATSKATRMLFTGLTPGGDYQFQVRSRGTKGVSNWSQPVRFIAR